MICTDNIVVGKVKMDAEVDCFITDDVRSMMVDPGSEWRDGKSYIYLVHVIRYMTYEEEHVAVWSMW